MIRRQRGRRVSNDGAGPPSAGPGAGRGEGGGDERFVDVAGGVRPPPRRSAGGRVQEEGRQAGRRAPAPPDRASAKRGSGADRAWIAPSVASARRRMASSATCTSATTASKWIRPGGVRYRGTSTGCARTPVPRSRLEGHADSRGTIEYNLALGAKRAKSVKDYLINQGIAADRISTISYGEELPLCQEENESCWGRNRRVALRGPRSVRRYVLWAGVLCTLAGCATRADLLRQDQQFRGVMQDQRRQLQSVQRELEQLRSDTRGTRAQEPRRRTVERRPADGARAARAAARRWQRRHRDGSAHRADAHPSVGDTPGWAAAFGRVGADPRASAGSGCRRRVASRDRARTVGRGRDRRARAQRISRRCSTGSRVRTVRGACRS